MNEALIYEKFGPEDQLTSDIFGLLRYLPPKLILEPFLERATCFDDAEERRLGQRIGFSPGKASFYFWPSARLPATQSSRSLDRQPDLLMLLSGDSGESAAIIVEVKYRGIKHNVDARLQEEGSVPVQQNAIFEAERVKEAQDQQLGGDQLENYLRALLNNELSLRTGTIRSAKILTKVTREYTHQEVRLKEIPRDSRFLLYLTDGDALRQDERVTTLNRFGLSFTLPKSECLRLFWLGWPTLFEIVEAKLPNLSASEELYRPILEDISRLLDARDLRAFSGWKDIVYEATLPNDEYFWKPKWNAGIRPLSREVLASINFWTQSSEEPARDR